MLPWKTIIHIQKDASRPVYLQVTDAVIAEIKQGILRPGTKMPGTRAMAQGLALNRQTVVRAYDELYAQGWLELRQSQGTFVSESLPEIKPVRLEPEKSVVAGQSGFRLSINTGIHAPAKPNRHMTGFHDGPDVRLVPAELLSRGYKRVLGRAAGRLLLSYIDIEGTEYVRQAIAGYLNDSRGLQADTQNILITRGTQMAMYLLAQVLLEKGDAVITASVGYRYAELTFLHAGARLVKVPVDDEGLDVDAVERECRQGRIRALYVTSHHHYPTTVTMSAARRMKLLRLAEEFRFVIIEDDYDYEFHYESSPILPLASAGHPDGLRGGPSGPDPRAG
jgi:GntR family transcriptional regulator/MocR family aminotransferase